MIKHKELNHNSENTLEKKEAILTKVAKYQQLKCKSKANLFSPYFRKKLYFQII